MPVTEGWSPSLLVGMPEIDEQHRTIFDAIDGLLTALRHGYGDREVVSTLQSLETYAGDHFRMEESLMKRTFCPDLANHVSAHEAFASCLGELRTTLQQAGASKALAVQTLQAIGKLLMQDIETHDRKLAAFLKHKAS